MWFLIIVVLCAIVQQAASLQKAQKESLIFVHEVDQMALILTYVL